jgi:hypothetical protein
MCAYTSTTDMLAMLCREHRELERCFDEAAMTGKRHALADLLVRHAHTEESVLKVALNGQPVPALDRLRALANNLKADLDTEPDAARWAAWREALIEQHCHEEAELFAYAREVLTAERLESLGRLLAVLRVQWHAVGATRAWL